MHNRHLYNALWRITCQEIALNHKKLWPTMNELMMQQLNKLKREHDIVYQVLQRKTKTELERGLLTKKGLPESALLSGNDCRIFIVRTSDIEWVLADPDSLYLESLPEDVDYALVYSDGTEHLMMGDSPLAAAIKRIGKGFLWKVNAEEWKE